MQPYVTSRLAMRNLREMFCCATTVLSREYVLVAVAVVRTRADR